MTDVTEVQLVGGPHDGLRVPLTSSTDGDVIRVGRLRGSMIGEDGRVVPPSALTYVVDQYRRSGPGRYEHVREAK